MKLKLEGRQKEDDRGSTAFSDTTRAEAAAEERARRVARIIERRREAAGYNTPAKLYRSTEVCWNFGDAFERLEFSASGITNTLFRIDMYLWSLSIDGYLALDSLLLRELCIARVVGLHMSMRRLRKRRKREAEKALRDAETARLKAELALLRRERDIERKLAMESEGT